MGSGGGLVRALFGAIALVVFIGFLFVGVLAGGGTKTTTTTVTTKRFKNSEGPVVHPDLDPNWMSKRRVPNGPDPIHNRKAGKSKQPPGRA